VARQLVAQGRTVWERALDAPDSLADVGVDPGDDMVECEDLVAALSTSCADATGEEEAFWEAMDTARGDRPEVGFGDPAGEDFDFDDAEQVRARLPASQRSTSPRRGRRGRQDARDVRGPSNRRRGQRPVPP
jgi:hypothetical protein